MTRAADARPVVVGVGDRADNELVVAEQNVSSASCADRQTSPRSSGSSDQGPFTSHEECSVMVVR